MPENEDNSFMSVEGELSRLVSHLETLKQEVQHYQSAAQQLNSGREDIRTAGATVSEQGKSMVDAMTTASSAIESAVHALKPLGTSKITAAMQSMEDRITKTATDIEGQFDTLGRIAKQMAEALDERIAGIERTLQQHDSDNQKRNSELLDAIEHSAPVGVFRKKRTK